MLGIHSTDALEKFHAMQAENVLHKISIMLSDISDKFNLKDVSSDLV